MSAHAVTLWFIDTDDAVGTLRAGVVNDVFVSQRIASAIYGDRVLVPAIDTSLDAAMNAGDQYIYVGHYGGLTVLSSPLFASVRPSTLTRTIESIRESAFIPETATATLLYTDPWTSAGVFARWEGGVLRRSFAADPVDILEDQGVPYPFERPFWAGEHPLRYAPGVAPDPLALPFHPQQLAEQANREWLGFRFTLPLAPTDLDPALLPVTGYSIHPLGYVPTAEDADRYRAATAATRADAQARKAAQARIAAGLAAITPQPPVTDPFPHIPQTPQPTETRQPTETPHPAQASQPAQTSSFTAPQAHAPYPQPPYPQPPYP
ncbi:MAG: hypothetical protein QM673_13970, partial [Gordonia sp. (in: high G+C Gram-positive bacteria)]